MPSLKVNFKTPKQSKEFMKNFSVLGLKGTTANEQGGAIIIKTPDKKSHEFVKQMINDLKADMKLEQVSANMVNAIIESNDSGENLVVKTLDGSEVIVTPKLSSEFIHLHDNIINEDNLSSVLISLLIESKDSFEKTSNFVNKLPKNESK